MTTLGQNLNAQIAELVYHRDFDEALDRYTFDSEAAEELLEHLVAQGIRPQVAGNTVTLVRRGQRVASASGDTTLIALARAVVKLAREAGVHA